MAAKARPSSAYGPPGSRDQRILSIGSKAPAPAPPSRLRSPPRPPPSLFSRGVIGKPSSPTGPPPLRSTYGKVTSPPRRESYRSTTNGITHRPAPTSSSPDFPLATPKWSARAAPAVSGNRYANDKPSSDLQLDAELDPELDPEFSVGDSGRIDIWGQDAEEFQDEAEQDHMEDMLPQEQAEEEFGGEFEEPFEADEDDAELYREIDPDVHEEEEAGLEESQDAEHSLPCREGDLSLDEIPEDQREAVEGSLQLKRALSQDLKSFSAAKRRRLDAGPPPIQNETAQRLVRQWRLERDSTTSFVLRMADPSAVETLAKTRWTPNPGNKRTPGEQVYEQLTKLGERQGPPGGPLDAVAAFGHRWRLSAADDEQLAKLDHRSMRHVFREYDKSRPLHEVIEDTQAGAAFDDDDVAAPDKPGLYVLGRSQCLELIDPFGDAIVLGDANLTFSLQLAEHRKSLHHAGRTVATTFETRETLLERYPEIVDTIKALEDLGAEVLHNVDCTRLAVDPRFQGMEDKFGAVYYNFPHAGVVPGFFDNHPFVRWRHANLMHLFFRALRTFVKPGGVVKVASNSGATGVRFSDIIGGASASEFAHAETFPFLEWTLARYRRSYGDRRDAQKRPDDGEVYRDQRAHSDMVYCFTYTPTGNPLKAPSISYPPTKEELLASNEGRAGRLPSQAAARSKRVEELYELFLSYVQGIHVG